MQVPTWTGPVQGCCSTPHGQLRALLTVGTAGSTVSHASNPISSRTCSSDRRDIAGKATASLVVNANDTIVDDIWPGAPTTQLRTVGWTPTPPTTHDVNGNNVRRPACSSALPEDRGRLERPKRKGDLLPERDAVRPAQPGPDERLVQWLSRDRVASNVTRSAVGSAATATSTSIRPSTRQRFEAQHPGDAFHDLLTSPGRVGTITNVINTTERSRPPTPLRVTCDLPVADHRTSAAADPVPNLPAAAAFPGRFLTLRTQT